MENTVTYTMDDGTEYRLTYDNETGNREQMHYLLHENGVLKLECQHHALPGDMTEEEFRSSLVPSAFFNCLGRNIIAQEQRQMMEASGNEHLSQLAAFVRPHVTLTPEGGAWLTTVVDRGHSVEIALQLAKEQEVERFARQLSAQPDYTPGFIELAGRAGDEDGEDYVRPAFGKFVAVILVSGALAIGASYGLAFLLSLLGWA